VPPQSGHETVLDEDSEVPRIWPEYELIQPTVQVTVDLVPLPTKFVESTHVSSRVGNSDLGTYPDPRLCRQHHVAFSSQEDSDRYSRKTAIVTNPISPSSIGRLLEEISWEGNARNYRGGGLGMENVLTAEVFSALDFLPREAFLGEIIRQTHGDSATPRHALVNAIETATVTVLPGDVPQADSQADSGTWRVQPDVLIDSPTAVGFVEAKRIRSSQFQEHQLLKTFAALGTYAGKRDSLLIVVTSEPPPYRVERQGRLSIAESIEHSLSIVSDPDERNRLRSAAETSICWTTWDEIAAIVSTSATSTAPDAGPAAGTIERLAASVSDAVSRHS
jgi:hypothetical protein